MLYEQLSVFFKNKPCKVFLAPLDVFFTESSEDIEHCSTVLQPDLMVVYDPDKLIDEGIHGAPDLILEILSPSTAMRDQTDKKNLYETKGVREYWIVNPENLEIFRYVLEGAHYGLAHPGRLQDGVETGLFPGLVLSSN